MAFAIHGEMMRFHAADLRAGRVSMPGQIYLLTAVTDARYPLFQDFFLGRAVVAALRARAEHAETLAFVVMPDHLHWLMRLQQGDLGRVMQRVKVDSAQRFNHLRGGTGRVWQRGFHDRAIRRDEDLLGVARYVIANPVRAGLVKRVGDYPLWDAIWL